MVRRSSDEPRSITGGLAASLKRDEELARAAGRGSTALRDSAGNVLQMNADAPYPLLRPMGVDASVAFTQSGTVKIVSPDTLEDRDMTVRDVASSGKVEGNFVGARDIAADKVGCGFVETGNVQINGAGDFGGLVCDHIGTNVLGVGTVNAAQLNGRINDGVWRAPVDNGAGNVRTNDVGCNHIGCGVGNFGDLSYVRLVPPPSERRLKHHESDIDDGLEVVRALRPARWRWREQPSAGPGITSPPDREVHAGVYVDELATAAPELVVDRPDGETRTYEDRGLIAYLCSAVATLADRVDDLTARLDAAGQS